MIKIQFRRKPAPPVEPQYQRPENVGAYRFTLRSTPRHHDEIRALIERGGANVYFSEPLAYLRGQGVSLFRVETKTLDFLDELYEWWPKKEHEEAFAFDINLFFNDRQWVASLREHTPDEIKRMIEEHAPRVTEEDLLPHERRRSETPRS